MRKKSSMRFSIFFTFLVATFVVSGDSVSSAKASFLDDRIYDSTEARHLRGNDDVNEERVSPIVGEEVAEEIVASTSKTLGPKSESEEQEALQKTIAESLDRMGRKRFVPKKKTPYETFALFLLSVAVAAVTAFVIHHLMSEAYDPKTVIPSTTETTTSGSA